jgi:hypothetical protein
MITDTEKELLKEIEAEFHANLFKVGGVELTPDEKTQAVGGSMAMYDALFAIREGTAWRGMTDPQVIAKKALQQAGLGDPD